MKNRAGISARQFYVLTFAITVGASILIIPIGLAGTAREDAWIGATVSLAINLAMVVLYIMIARLHPGKNIFEIHEAVCGKWLGGFLSLMYLFFFLLIIGAILGDMGFFMSSEVMPDTPIEALQIVFLIAVIVSAHMGIIVLARVGELIFPWVTILFLFLALALVPQIDLNYIKPVLEDGWGPVLKAGYQASLFQENIILMTFLPLVRKPRSGEKAYIWGTLSGGIVLILITLLSILVLGIEQTENSTFPAYALAKTINLGNILQRVEGLLITIWVLTFFIKLALFYLTFLKGLQTVFRLKAPEYLIYPLAVLFLIIAWTTYINTVYVNENIAQVWGKYALVFLLLIPVLLYLVSLLKKALHRR